MKFYTWDSQDHLTEVKRGVDAQNAQTIAAYAYDTDGNRVQKTEPTAQGDQVTRYLIDDTFAYAQVVEAKTQLGSHTDSERYLWGDGGLLAQAQGKQTRYAHADGLGSIKALSDSDGMLTDSYGYDAFGNVQDSTETSTQPYRFAGEHFDPDAQMQYHRARWYDPEVGRFASLDPFSGNPRRPATLHKYAYVGSEPVNSVDPSGLMTLVGTMSGINVSLNLATIALPSIGRYALKTVFKQLAL